MRAAVVVLAFLVGASVAAAGAVDLSKDRPVSKVISLLKDMTTELEKEAAQDEEIYETMGCWCETNDKEKTKSIADAEARIANLNTEIEELTAKSSRLNSEIATLNAEVAKNQDVVNEATALRNKQLAEFTGEEQSMLGSIGSLKGAVTALEKHHTAASLLALSDEEKVALMATVQHEMHKHKALIAEAISPRQRRTLESFAQQPDGFFDDASFAQESSKQPQSGQIFGILKQMKETFETNLAGSQKEETTNNKAFEDLKAAKDKEIAAGQKNVETKLQELATTDEKNAQAKMDKEDTERTLEADTKFLAHVKDKCANYDAEYEERVKTRQMEVEAVTKALEFLSSDEAHELFTRTLSASFLQREQRSERQRRGAVADVLRKAALKARDPRLSALAMKVRLDSFGKVKDTLTKMVENLSKEKEEDIKHKDGCVDGLRKNENSIADNDRLKEKLMAKIDDLTTTLDALNKAIDALKAEIADTKEQMKRAGENREIANKDFQLTVADQRATQKLLNAALNVLKGFYEKAGFQSLVQKKGGQKQEPAGFEKYDKGKGSGVIFQIQEIINEAHALETEAIYAETDAQKAYEEFVKDSNAAIEEMTRDLVGKTEVKGKTEKEKAETEVQRDETLDTLEALHEANHNLHADCDYILKNFEVRNTARDEEVEALKQAIAMFSGASFEGFLQSLGPLR